MWNTNQNLNRMKTKNYLARIPMLGILALAISAQAQFPQFTKVDTGVIVDLSTGHLNLSAHMFDVDNDGDIDPVIGYCSSDNNGNPTPLKLYRNEGNGLFIPSIFLPETSNAFTIRFTSPSADIDNDGDIDVIGQRKWSDLLSTFLNDGHGNFTSGMWFSLSNSLSSFYPTLLDFNGDGFTDILRFDDYIQILYNDGEGKFFEKDTIGHYGISGSPMHHSMSLADADDDGDMDVYCGHSFGTFRNYFFINTGDSLEQVGDDHITVSIFATTVSVNWIDYDNDGDMDLYVHYVTDDTINGTLPALYENLGDLEFARHTIQQADYRGTYSNSSNWADLDNDGDLDLFLPVENNTIPWDTNSPLSRNPYNMLFLNDGDGGFTEVTNNSLTQNICHTAEIFDFDNDGDLDVLTIGNAWKTNGHNQLFVNESNSNNSILINCTDRYGCATPFGSRIYAMTEIFGKRVLQTREITPVDGNLSFANTRIHFGLGDADAVDTLIIRWPSGHIDTYFDVKANQFYRATEENGLAIDFAATNHIQYSPGFYDIHFEEIGENISIDLSKHYHFIKGDTVPPISGDTLTYSVYDNKNPGVVQATVEGNTLTLVADSIGLSTVKILASAGFTERVDDFDVGVAVGLAEHDLNPFSIHLYPHPFKDEVTIAYELSETSEIKLDIYNCSGQRIATLVDAVKQQGMYELCYDGRELKPGIYFCVLKTGKKVQTVKLIKF